MKKLFSLLMVFGALLVAGCGGGGGDAGSPGSSSSSTSTTGAYALTLSLVDANGATIVNKALSQTEQRFVKVVVKTSRGQTVPYERVELAVTAGETLAVITPSSGALLTDGNGEVRFQISPASVAAQGAVTVTATVKIAETTATGTLSLQITAGSVVLSGFTVSPSVVQKGQAVNVGVLVTVNGAVAPSNSVGVTFTSNCGTVAPATAVVGSDGRANAVIQTTQTGACVVTANVSGASPVSSSYTVNSAPIASLQFVSAAPETIYQSNSPGVNVALVKFRLLDSVGLPVQGQQIQASLSNTDGGINFCNSPSSGPTDSSGEVSFSVCAGTLPTVVTVKAELVSNTAIFTNSNRLTIQTGLPTQRFFDLSASMLNFYVGAGFTDKFSGKTIDLNIFAADRQGNPVPNGTSVVFVSEGGQLNTTGNSSCILTDGGCKVKLIGQEYRPWGSNAAGADPRPGRVTVLAYADGEESFVDANQNNRYDLGEAFEDLGIPYLEKDENNTYTASFSNLIVNTADGENQYPLPAGASGALACSPATVNVGLSAQNTCNGVWDGKTKVRRKITIVFSGGEICPPASYDASIPSTKRTQVWSAARGGVSVQLADCNGNPLPADAALSFEVVDPDESGCTGKLGGTVIGSTIEPTTHGVALTKCTGDETAVFKVTVDGKTTSFSVAVP